MSLLFPPSNRQPTVDSSLCTTLRADRVIVLPGAGIVDLLETGGVTSIAYTYDLVVTPTTVPATTIANYFSSLGHLLDIFAATNNAGVEIRVDLATSSTSAGTFWRALTVALTPGVPSLVNAFRVNPHLARIELFNTSGVNVTVDYSVHVRSK